MEQEARGTFSLTAFMRLATGHVSPRGQFNTLIRRYMYCAGGKREGKTKSVGRNWRNSTVGGLQVGVQNSGRDLELRPEARRGRTDRTGQGRLAEKKTRCNFVDRWSS